VTTFLDTQDVQHPRNGTVVPDAGDLARLMASLRTRRPFSFMLKADRGRTLLVGMGPRAGCVQYSDDRALATMAVAPGGGVLDHPMDFFTGDTPTPVPPRNVMPFPDVQRIATWFVEYRTQDPGFSWEVV
jgi:hypothetical protein